MYGRAGFDLLRKRVTLHPALPDHKIRGRAKLRERPQPQILTRSPATSIQVVISYTIPNGRSHTQRHRPASPSARMTRSVRHRWPAPKGPRSYRSNPLCLWCQEVQRRRWLRRPLALLACRACYGAPFPRVSRVLRIALTRGLRPPCDTRVSTTPGAGRAGRPGACPRGARPVALEVPGRDRRVGTGPGVACPKSRCSGCNPVTLAEEPFPGCPPGPQLVLAARAASAFRCF
jgi:hypothetical protein